MAFELHLEEIEFRELRIKLEQNNLEKNFNSQHWKSVASLSQIHIGLVQLLFTFTSDTHKLPSLEYIVICDSRSKQPFSIR